MEKELIDLVAAELNAALAATRFRALTQIGKYRFVLTFEGDVFRRILISIEPRDPRIYLIQRRDRDLKKLAVHKILFAIEVEKALAGSAFASLKAWKDERVIEIGFDKTNGSVLVIQLTGSSSNLFLLNKDRSIIAAARPSSGQTVGSTYSFQSNRIVPTLTTPLFTTIDGSISAALDSHYSNVDAEAGLQKLVASARSKNRQQIAKAERLIGNLENDLAGHGDAEMWKRFGDLLLASQNNAVRSHGVIEVVDVFDEMQPTVSIEANDYDSLPETAQKYFRRYAKARNARIEVQERLEKVGKDIARLNEIGKEIEQAVERRDVEFLSRRTGAKPEAAKRPSKKADAKNLSGIRTYISSDGFDILAGKKSTDNDHLTQRVAHSRDTWMHAADYPGSHVVIRNANRKNIPQRTLIEAAQLAAFFSQGKKQTKAAVNYTEKKYVSKPKGAAPGLVRLSSFKTLLVEPMFPNVKKKDEI